MINYYEKKNQEIQYTIIHMIKPQLLFAFQWANYLQFLWYLFFLVLSCFEDYR